MRIVPCRVNRQIELPSRPNRKSTAGARSAQWLNNELKKPSNPLVAGVGAAPGAVASYGAAVPAPAASAGDGARPPCSGQICVGAVPLRKGMVAIRGQPAVARPPLSGSIVAIVIPAGTANGAEVRGVTSSMKLTHAGSAAVAPDAPRLCGRSNPTHTPLTTRGV